MKKPVIKELYKFTTLTVGILASVFSIGIFFLQFQSVEYLKFIIGILGALIGVVVAFSLAKIRTALGAPKIFISYSHDDLDFVLKLCKELENLPVSLLLDRYELQVGDTIKDKMSEMVNESDYFLTVVSKNSANSEWLNHELGSAIKKNKRILPVVIDSSSIPETIQGLFYANFVDSFDEGMYQLSKALRATKHNKKIQRTV